MIANKTDAFNMDSWRSKLNDTMQNALRSRTSVEKILSDGSHFHGIVNRLTGDPVKGVQTTKNGEVYDGCFEPGEVRSGECTLENRMEQTKFLGTYCEGRRVEGTLITESFLFQGKFSEQGAFSMGKIVRDDGSNYEGEFDGGLLEPVSDGDNHYHFGYYHGAGKLTYSDGSIYKGDFYRSKRHGIGSFVSSDESYTFSGVFRMDAKEGEGIEIQRDKGTGKEEKYEGQFHNNKRHGQGKLSMTDGSLLEGTFRSGLPMPGKWQITYPNKSKYSGEANGDLEPHGSGTMVYSNDDIYTGEFHKGLRHGEGICIFNYGESYEGTWVADIPQGLDLSLSPDEHDASCDEVLGRKKIFQSIRASHDTPDSTLINVSLNEKESALDDEIKDERDIKLDGFISRLKLKRLRSKDKQKYELHTYDNGNTFYGIMDKKGLRQGFGHYFEQCSSSTYEGFWIDDKRNGHGILICGNERYDGEFVNDKREGAGTLISSDSSTYSGNWKNNLFHGNGLLCRSDGSSYEGEFSLGVEDGSGKAYYMDETYYEGEFKSGLRHGNGTLYTKDKESSSNLIYSGEWKQDKPNGDGIQFYKKAKEIELLDMAPEHKTSNLLSTQDSKSLRDVKYVGAFVEGKRSGHGTLTYSNGIVIEGLWRRGFPISPGDWKISFGSEAIFSGEASFSSESDSSVQRDYTLFPIPNGFGVITYENGDAFSGFFVDGRRDGEGTCVFANGERWSGTWKNDSIDMDDGTGELHLVDGTVHKFINGQVSLETKSESA